MIATSARTSVRLSPCSSANRCPTASSSTVSRRSRSAISTRGPRPPGTSVVRRDISRRSRLSTVKGNHASPPSAARWLLPAIIALLWLGLAGPLGSLGGGLSDVQENDSAAFLPDSAESTRVTELQRGFQTSRALPVILLWEGDGARSTSSSWRRSATASTRPRRSPTTRALAGEASPPIPSQDGAAVQAVLPIQPDVTDELPALVADLRGDRRRRRDDGVRHRTRRLVLRLRRRLLRHRRPAAARGVRRRPADPARRLPQPDPAVPRHRHRRPGAHRLDGGRLPAGQGRLDRGQRPEPGHLLDPRRGRRHRLRPAAGRPLPRGTARGAVEVHGDADRPEAVVGAHRRERRHGRSSASCACCCPTSAPTAASARSPR